MAFEVKLPDGSYQSKSLPFVNMEVVNFYIDIPKTTDAISQKMFIGRPGIQMAVEDPRVSVFYGECRALYTMNNRLYSFNDSLMYYINKNNERADKTGTLTISGDPKRLLSIADNGTYMAIVHREKDSSYNGYVYSEAGGLQYITDTDFYANGIPQSVVFIDGYYVFSTDEKKLIASDLNDPTSIDPLVFGSAETDPDEIVCVKSIRNLLYAVGRNTLEEFANVGAGVFPFQRTGTFFKIGARCPYSVITQNDIIYFVGSEKNGTNAIYACNGSTCDRISHEGIDTYLANLTNEELDNLEAVEFFHEGHGFVVFSATYTSFVYNSTNGTWTEWRSHHKDPWDGYQYFVNTRWRVKSIASAYGKLYVGDITDMRIGTLSSDIHREYEDADYSQDIADIRRWVTTSIIKSSDNKPFNLNMVKLMMESGVGLPDDDYITLLDNIFDEDAGQFNDDDTYGWSVYDNNTIENEDGKLKITCVDNSYGAYLYLIAARDLTEDMAASTSYELSFDAYYEGDENPNIRLLVNGVGVLATVYSNYLTTENKRYSIKFTTGLSPNATAIRFDEMANGDIVYIDNIILQPFGTNAEEYEGPLISMAISEDGKTYGMERYRSIGKLGEYKLQQIWRNNGRFERPIICKFETSANCRIAIYGVYAE